MARGNQDRAIFAGDTARQRFLETLAESCEKAGSANRISFRLLGESGREPNESEARAQAGACARSLAGVRTPRQTVKCKSVTILGLTLSRRGREGDDLELRPVSRFSEQQDL